MKPIPSIRGEMSSFSPAAQRNKEPILSVLKETLSAEDVNILEIGSGTGQHGVFFARNFPDKNWFFSDRRENLPGIKERMEDAKLDNALGPFEYEVGKDPFPPGKFDLAFTANTFHIMSWKLVKTFMKALEKALKPGDRLAVYGPFKYNGVFTSESNEAFDKMLKSRDPVSGIRSFEDVKAQAESKGFRLVKDYGMPANNRMLVFIML